MNKIQSIIWILISFMIFSCSKGNNESPSVNRHKVDFRYAPRSWQTCYGLKDDLHKSMIAHNGALYYDYSQKENIVQPYIDNTYGGKRGYQIKIRPLISGFGEMVSKQKILDEKIPVIITHHIANDIALKQETWASYLDKDNKLDTRLDYSHFEVNNSSSSKKFVHLQFEIVSKYPLNLKRKHNEVVYDTAKVPAVLFKSSWDIDSLIERQRNKGHLYTLYFHPINLDQEVTKGLTIAIPRSNISIPHKIFTSPNQDKEKMIAYWKGLDLPYDKISIPDTNIQRLYHSAIRNIYQAREVKEGVPYFQVGPTHYRGTWAVDGPFFYEGMTYLSKDDEVRKAIEAVLSKGESQGPGGLRFSKQAGLRIWMIFRHAQLTDDWQWLKNHWEYLVAEVNNIQSYREKSYDDTSTYNDGLMPIGFGDGGVRGLHSEYTNVYWTLGGLKYAVEAAEKLNMPEYGSWKKEYDDYRDTFNRARKRDKKTDEYGNTYLPVLMDAEPPTITNGKWAFLHSVFPLKLYNNNDAIMQGTMAMLDSNTREGLIYGTGWIRDGIWNYAASFYGHAHLWLSNSEKVSSILYAFANHASPLLCWAEEQHPVNYEGTYRLHGDKCRVYTPDQTYVNTGKR